MLQLSPQSQTKLLRWIGCARRQTAAMTTCGALLSGVSLAVTACGAAPVVETEDDAKAPVRPLVLLRHANGQPSVVAYVRGETRVRDEHYNPEGIKIADVTYSDRGHRGAWKQYSASGEVQASYHVVDGKKEGQEWRFDVEGHRIAIVPYKNGVREGVQFEFLPTGEKRTELRFKAGDPDGPMTLFYATGEREAVVNIVNERKHGMQVEYNKNGTLRAEVPYHFGIMDGLATYYDDHGLKLATMPYVQGVPKGVETRFYVSGKVKMTVPLVDGERHGLAVLYTTDGFKQSEIPFVHGRVEGFDRRYSHILSRMIAAVKYHDDLPAGAVLTFHPSNYLASERLYTDLDKQNGTETRFYEPGPNDVTPVDANPENPARSAKAMEVPVVNDLKQGEATFYARDGSKLSKLTFVQDHRNGIESRYYPPENGLQVKQSEFKWANDTLVGMGQTWWKNGNRQSEFPMQDGKGSGVETRWDINGKMRFRVPLVGGEKEGTAELFDPKTAARVATMQYAKDVQEGEEVRFDAKGKVKIIYIWRGGFLQSALTPKRKPIDIAKFLTPEELETLSDAKALQDPSAIIAKAKAWRAERAEQHERESLAAGAMAIRAGTIETFFRDRPGQVQSKFPASGNGLEVQYHKNGEASMVVPLVGGQRNGMARIYDETGTLWATVPFVRGSKHGVEIRYARTGEKIAEYPYRADQPVGIARTWYTDGSKQSEYNFEPVGRGTEVQYHRNGEVRLHIPMVDGKRQGLATVYTETGVKWAEVPYLLGQRHGTEVRFDTDGKRAREIVWRNGKQVSDAPVSGK